MEFYSIIMWLCLYVRNEVKIKCVKNRSKIESFKHQMSWYWQFNIWKKEWERETKIYIYIYKFTVACALWMTITMNIPFNPDYLWPLFNVNPCHHYTFNTCINECASSLAFSMCSIFFLSLFCTHSQAGIISHLLFNCDL